MVPAPVLLGVPPLSLAERRGRAPLCGGVSSPFPLSSAARVKCSRPFGGGLSVIASPAARPAALSLLRVLSPPSVCWAVPSPPLHPLPLGARGRYGGGASLPLPRRPFAPSRPLSSGCCPPLPSAVVILATAPASLFLGLPPPQPEPRRGSGPASARRCRCTLLRGRFSCSLGCRPPLQTDVLCQPPAPALLSLGLPPPPPEPRRGSGPEITRPRQCLPLLGSPLRPVAPIRPHHWAPTPGFVWWGVGFRSPPPALVRPPLPWIETLVGLPGFCLPWDPCLLWGLSCPFTTRLLLLMCPGRQ